jgi:hypothetical protein
MARVEGKLRDGKAECPYSATGYADIETCWRCPRLREFYDDEEGTNVVCAVPPALLVAVLPRLRPHHHA